MESLRRGDRVISTKYGEGIITGKSSCDGCVLATFPDAADNVYVAATGKRYLKIGSDIITRLEDSHD